MKLSSLHKVNLRDIWPKEATSFTPWLAMPENLRLLGDALGLVLHCEEQEKDVGPFRADIYCTDICGSPVLVENQLETTDHTHLGQLLTYAAGLEAVTIVWVARQFTDEHRAAFDWLNEKTEDGVNFFGLEVELWRIGDSPPAPKFNVVCRPNNWSRSVRQDQGSAAGTVQTAFLDELAKVLEEKKSVVKLQNARKGGWVAFSIGKTNFYGWVDVSARKKTLSVGLTFHGDNAKTNFNRLKQEKDAIESDMHVPLVWEEQPDRKACYAYITKREVDLTNRGQWPDAIKWAVGIGEAIYKTFSGRIKKLDVIVSE